MCPGVPHNGLSIQAWDYKRGQRTVPCLCSWLRGVLVHLTMEWGVLSNSGGIWMEVRSSAMYRVFERVLSQRWSTRWEFVHREAAWMPLCQVLSLSVSSYLQSGRCCYICCTSHVHLLLVSQRHENVNFRLTSEDLPLQLLSLSIAHRFHRRWSL